MDKVAKEFEDALCAEIKAPIPSDGVFSRVASFKRHEEAGLWGTTGLLVTMDDGALYQIAIVRLPGDPA